MSDQMDQRNQWRFVPAGDKWKWIVITPDGTQSESAEEFSTLAECSTDAAKHGYVAWKSEDERRRELKLGVMDALKPKE